MDKWSNTGNMDLYSQSNTTEADTTLSVKHLQPKSKQPQKKLKITLKKWCSFIPLTQ